MKELTNAQDDRKDNRPQRELTEELFLEQFAALEESVALLQAHMQSLTANVKLFGSMARHVRRSTCPATPSPDRMSDRRQDATAERDAWHATLVQGRCGDCTCLQFTASE